MDDELDFEEDIDFGNVDSLLYETTDDINDTENKSDNEEKTVDTDDEEKSEENEEEVEDNQRLVDSEEEVEEEEKQTDVDSQEEDDDQRVVDSQVLEEEEEEEEEEQSDIDCQEEEKEEQRHVDGQEDEEPEQNEENQVETIDVFGHLENFLQMFEETPKQKNCSKESDNKRTTINSITNTSPKKASIATPNAAGITTSNTSTKVAPIATSNATPNTAGITPNTASKKAAKVASTLTPNTSTKVSPIAIPNTARITTSNTSTKVAPIATPNAGPKKHSIATPNAAGITTSNTSTKVATIAASKKAAKVASIATPNAAAKKDTIATPKTAGITTSNTSAKVAPIATSNASPKKDSIATPKAAPNKDSIATPKAAPNKDSIATPKAAPNKDSIATPKAAPNKDSIATPNAAPIKAAKVAPTPTPNTSTKVAPTPTPNTSTKVAPTPTPNTSTKVAPTPTPNTSTKVAPTPTPNTSTKVAPTPTQNTAPKVAPIATSNTTIPMLRKTVDLDLKYYNSMRIYLTKGLIIGYAEDAFREEAKKFRLKNGKLLLNSREVIETEQRQQDIASEFHLNVAAKSEKSRHRGVKATVSAIDKKYFWGTIKYDVENVINRCIICNPKEYDLTSYQLWKYIEIGVIENVLIVRDLNEKSSIFNCAFLEDFNALDLSKHLIDLFKTYGTPNAIRFVLKNESQKSQKLFIEDLHKYLRNGLLEFIQEVEFVSENSTDKERVKLPMVDIKEEYDPKDCPKSEKDLQLRYAISADKDISLLYIFSCNDWLIRPPIFTTIATDIKNFSKRFSNWKTRVSSLTLYFQIKGINLKANEEEEEEESNTQESSSSQIKTRKSFQSRELERLQSDFKPFKPPPKTETKMEEKTKKSHSSKKKRVSVESSESSNWSDDLLSDASSKRSNTSTKKHKKKRESKEKKTQENTTKEQPFKEMLREHKKTERLSQDSIELIHLEDDSQQSANSHFSAVISVSSESKSPEPIIPEKVESDSEAKENMNKDLDKYDKNGNCQPCAVYIEMFSQHDIEKAIQGNYDFEEVINNIDTTSKPVIQSQEIVLSEDSNTSTEGVNGNVSQESRDMAVISTEKPETNALKAVIFNELKERKSSSIGLNLSESSSEDETAVTTAKSKSETTTSQKTPSTPPKSSPTVVKSQTPVTSRSKQKRKRSSKYSDSDSDYEVKKDESLSSIKKRVKFVNNSKTSVNPKSKKRGTKQISKRIVASASSDSESVEDNQENHKNNSTKDKPKPKTVTNSETTNQVFKCSYCDFETNEKMNFIMHTTKHKNEPKNRILCPDCSKVFYSKDALERHKEEEHPPTILNAILYGCETCKEFSCYSIEELDQHLMSHIEDLSFMKTTNSKFRCELCKTFTAPNKEVMSTHLSQKHRMFRCAFDCPFNSAEFQTLQRFAIIFEKVLFISLNFVYLKSRQISPSPLWQSF